MKTTQLAAQLYTCRDLLKTPAEIAKTLHRVREIGYTAVQISGMGPIPEEELNTILDGEGLICCATHEGAEVILNHPEKVVERLEKLHCKHTAYPYPANVDLGSEVSVDGMIGKLDAAGAVLAAAGQTLCYHNHNHEFRKLGGKLILERIFDMTSHVQGELDTYWVHFGGGDNVEWCERLAGRLPLLHLKDYMTTEENKPNYCEIGAGNLSFAKIIAAAEKSGCEWFIVEQDVCPGDPVDSLAQSFRYLTENLVD
ncbi:MAG: sugar phosphate isomerase/epimerase [Terrimicrobiaceae bacterium]